MAALSRTTRYFAPFFALGEAFLAGFAFALVFVVLAAIAWTPFAWSGPSEVRRSPASTPGTSLRVTLW